jgi:hypothetical protein
MVREAFLVGCDDLDRGAEQAGEMPDDLLRDSSKIPGEPLGMQRDCAVETPY